MKLKNLILTASVAVVGASLLGSCNIYKKFEMPTDSALTEEYARQADLAVDSAAFGNLQWQEVFTDPMLVDLINRALQNNVNLDNARLNVEMAHASLKGARLSYLPSVALAPNGAGAGFGGNRLDWSGLSWSYQLPLSVSWEIDVFGKILNNKRNAQATYDQTKAYHQAVRSQIIAGVANTYYAISMVRSQLELNRETAENWRQSVEVMKNLKEAGRLNETAVVQSRAQYYGILASITDLETSLNELNNTMSLLLNVAPQQWAVPTYATIGTPAIMRDAIPMRELAARPDVRAAEQGLAAAYYSTAGARAAFYPGLSITANGGFTNLLGSVIMNPGEFFLNLAGSLTVPIFMRGQNIARLEAAKAQQQQALNNFEYALLNASAEVSNSMTAYEKAVEKQKLLTVQVENLEKSVEYTQELLTFGTSTYLEVLTAQTSLLSAQMGEIQCQNARDRAIINLYQALGGGR
ncbi:MAG: TolC family protein [Clostridium sp.]|nr:TolC family protein [Clostridium sp.]